MTKKKKTRKRIPVIPLPKTTDFPKDTSRRLTDTHIQFQKNIRTNPKDAETLKTLARYNEIALSRIYFNNMIRKASDEHLLYCLRREYIRNSQGKGESYPKEYFEPEKNIQIIDKLVHELLRHGARFNSDTRTSFYQEANVETLLKTVFFHLTRSCRDIEANLTITHAYVLLETWFNPSLFWYEGNNAAQDVLWYLERAEDDLAKEMYRKVVRESKSFLDIVYKEALMCLSPYIDIGHRNDCIREVYESRYDRMGEEAFSCIWKNGKGEWTDNGDRNAAKIAMQEKEKNNRLKTAKKSKTETEENKTSTGEENETDWEIEEIQFNSGEDYSLSNDKENKKKNKEDNNHEEEIKLEELSKKDIEALSPVTIKNYLDETIVGQDDAKESLSVALSEHLTNFVMAKNLRPGVTLIIGPSGSGKTMIARKLAEYKTLPISVVDTSQITADGWRGLDKADVLAPIFEHHSERVARYGIVVLDEFDKLCKNPKDNRVGVYSRKDQEALLSVLDGIPVYETSSHGDAAKAYDTSNIMFILTGSFSEMMKTEKEGKVNTIGFGSKDKKEIDRDIRQRLLEYGILPELIGRISNIVFTEALSEADILKALTESKDSFIEKHRKLAEYQGKDLHINPERLHDIIAYSMQHELGVRGARNLLEEEIRKKTFEAFRDNKPVIEVT